MSMLWCALRTHFFFVFNVQWHILYLSLWSLTFFLGNLGFLHGGREQSQARNNLCQRGGGPLLEHCLECVHEHIATQCWTNNRMCYSFWPIYIVHEYSLHWTSNLIFLENWHSQKKWNCQLSFACVVHIGDLTSKYLTFVFFNMYNIISLFWNSRCNNS